MAETANPHVHRKQWRWVCTKIKHLLALGVSLNASGRVVPGGAGQTGFVGVICHGRTLVAGAIIDVMTDGELVEVPTIPAGTKVYATAADGTLTATATGNTYIGHTVEAGRLVVRAKRP